MMIMTHMCECLYIESKNDYTYIQKILAKSSFY